MSGCSSTLINPCVLPVLAMALQAIPLGPVALAASQVWVLAKTGRAEIAALMDAAFQAARA